MSTLVVGVGSSHGDDRVGWLVAEALRSSAPPTVDVRQASAPSDLLDWLHGVDRLIVCDACAAPSGSDNDKAPVIHRWPWPTSSIACLRSSGSHVLGLPQVLELAGRLGALPSDVILFGVEGACFDPFAEPSPGILAAMDQIVASIAQELTDPQGADRYSVVEGDASGS